MCPSAFSFWDSNVGVVGEGWVNKSRLDMSIFSTKYRHWSNADQAMCLVYRGLVWCLLGMLKCDKGPFFLLFYCLFVFLNISFIFSIYLQILHWMTLCLCTVYLFPINNCVHSLWPNILYLCNFNILPNIPLIIFLYPSLSLFPIRLL